MNSISHAGTLLQYENMFVSLRTRWVYGRKTEQMRPVTHHELTTRPTWDSFQFTFPNFPSFHAFYLVTILSLIYSCVEMTNIEGSAVLWWTIIVSRRVYCYTAHTGGVAGTVGYPCRAQVPTEHMWGCNAADAQASLKYLNILLYHVWFWDGLRCILEPL